MNKDMPVIALLTDFGTADYFVGALKGVILSINPNARIVDITHEIAPQDIRSAAFTLRACYLDFPKKTIFAAVVDPGVGSSRRAILVETNEYFFVAPDNGLLSFVFHESKNYRVFELTNKEFFAQGVSATFHGRDVFAPVAAHLSKNFESAKFGCEIEKFIKFEETEPQKISSSITAGEIIHIDRFGNLITNFKREDLPENFVLTLKDDRIENLFDFYAQAAHGEVFMIFGSARFLEIVVFQGSAQDKFNVKRGQSVKAKML